MVGYLQPLAHNFAIVNELGYPTEYFIRWAQQKQIDIGESVGEARALEIVKTFLTEHPLQAGSGIDLTPDGDLNNSPTISAKAQEILDQIATTQGSVLFRGAAGWEALPPGTSTQYLKSGGPAANPLWETPAGGGGGGNPSCIFQSADVVSNGSTTGSFIQTHPYDIPAGLLSKVGDFLDIEFFGYFAAGANGVKGFSYSVGGNAIGGRTVTASVASMWFQSFRVVYLSDTTFRILDQGRHYGNGALGSAPLAVMSFMNITDPLSFGTGSWSSGLRFSPLVQSNVVSNASVYMTRINAYIAP